MNNTQPATVEELAKKWETEYPTGVPWRRMLSDVARATKTLTAQLKSEMERVKKLQRAIDVVHDLHVYPQSVIGGPNPYEKRTERMEGWNEAVMEMYKAIAEAEPNIETSYDKLVEYIENQLGHVNQHAHSIYEVIDYAAELCKPQPPAITNSAQASNPLVIQPATVEEVATLLCDVAQLLDGWHSDGTAWSEWDESVRKRVSAMQGRLNQVRRKESEKLTDLELSCAVIELWSGFELGSRHSEIAAEVISRLQRVNTGLKCQCDCACCGLGQHCGSVTCLAKEQPHIRIINDLLKRWSYHLTTPEQEALRYLLDCHHATESLTAQLKAEQSTHDRIASLCFALGAESGDGSSVAAVKSLCELLKAERERVVPDCYVYIPVNKVTGHLDWLSLVIYEDERRPIIKEYEWRKFQLLTTPPDGKEDR